jgi:PAS domain S-box-containing protein
MEVNGAPILQDDKVIRGIFIARDITEQENVRAALLQQLRFLETLMEAIPNPVFYKDTNGIYLGCNKAFETWVGLPRERIVGSNVYELNEAASKDFAEKYHQHDMELFEHPGIKVYESSACVEGAIHETLVYKATFSNPAGTLGGLVGVIVDISDRKRMEAALRSSEERNRLLIEESPIGICIVQHGACVYVNPTLVRILGWESPMDFLGRPIDEFVLSRNGDPLAPRQNEIVNVDEKVVNYEVRGLKSTGEEIDLALWPRRIEYAREPATVLFMADTTEAKKLRSQLIHAQKMEAIGILAGGVAHDFNNLLQVIQGYSELLQFDENMEDRVRSRLGKISHAARSGADLVKRLLAFSRKTEMHLRPVNLNDKIVQITSLLERTIPKSIRVVLHLPNELPAINADPSQMEQVLVNLAVNARDAMPDGGWLTIEAQHVTLDEDYCGRHLEAKPGDYVLVSVSDTGQGMENETLNRIFEPFYTTKEAGAGTGLGLATVYGIIKQHDGHIACHSELGVGTTFKIYLPIIETETESEPPSDESAIPRGTETVLLVDDEKVARDLGREILEHCGYITLTADNGKEALDLYRKEGDKIAMVILDLIMPEMGGKRCLEELLKIDPDAKILVASGLADEMQSNKSIEAGARGFVGKPYDMRSMLQAIRGVLDQP